MEQLCFNAGESILAIATSVITVASMLANFIPAPDKTSGVLKIISKIVHFLAVDLVTAKK